MWNIYTQIVESMISLRKLFFLAERIDYYFPRWVVWFCYLRRLCFVMSHISNNGPLLIQPTDLALSVRQQCLRRLENVNYCNVRQKSMICGPRMAFFRFLLFFSNIVADYSELTCTAQHIFCAWNSHPMFMFLYTFRKRSNC